VDIRNSYQYFKAIFPLQLQYLKSEKKDEFGEEAKNRSERELLLFIVC